MEKKYYTKEELQKLKDEIRKLEEEAADGDQLQHARAFGDLRENAEFKAAQASLKIKGTKAKQKRAMLVNAVVLDTSSIDTSRVSILTTVKVEQVDLGKVASYRLVATSNPDKGDLSIETVVGRALLGKKAGDVVKALTPAGEQTYKILEISI